VRKHFFRFVSVAALLAGTVVLSVPSASAGTGGCSFSGSYGIRSQPGLNDIAAGGQRAALVAPTGFVGVTGCTTGAMYVTGVPVATVNGTIVRVGTPMFCTFVIPYQPDILIGAGCSLIGTAMSVEVNEVQFLMTAEVVMVAANGGHAEAVATCLVSWSSYGDEVGSAGPRCPISG